MRKNDNQEYEICVSCKEVTDVRKDTPISHRTTYVEGAGQLCRECYHKLYEE
jgi:hypothetical protein